MNKYKAKFKLLAEVEVEVLVTAPNQVEGLVLAHDAVLMATPEEAAVIKLLAGDPKNLSFELVSSEKIESPQDRPPLSPLALQKGYTVAAFADRDCKGERLSTTDVQNYGRALAYAQELLDPLQSVVGSVCVWDLMGATLYTANARRGGWEVEIEEIEEAERNLVRFTWEASPADCVRIALRHLSAGAKRANIYDYTDRKVGPALWKSIK